MIWGKCGYVMGCAWVCGHIVRRRVAASPLCFADFEVRRRKKGEGVRRCGEDKTWKGLDFETLRYIPRYLGAKE